MQLLFLAAGVAVVVVGGVVVFVVVLVVFAVTCLVVGVLLMWSSFCFDTLATAVVIVDGCLGVWLLRVCLWLWLLVLLVAPLMLPHLALAHFLCIELHGAGMHLATGL